MKIITQLSAFDYSKIEILGNLERCKLVINNVLGEKNVKKLFSKWMRKKRDITIFFLFLKFRMTYIIRFDIIFIVDLIRGEV